MKNLLTKTLFISLLFSAITPAIQANDKLGSDAAFTLLRTEASTLLERSAIQVNKAPVSVGFFSKLGEQAANIRSYMGEQATSIGSCISENASGAYSYVVDQAKKADKKVVTIAGNYLAKYPKVGSFLAKHPKTTTGLRYSAYAVAATLTG